MPVDHIRYDLLTQQALRAVVRRVLSDVAKTGSLPGEHHFYVTFDTRSPGVKLSPRLREQYPGRDDHRAAAPVLGSRRHRGAFRGGALVQRHIREASRPARGDQRLLRSVGAVRPAVRDRRPRARAKFRPRPRSPPKRRRSPESRGASRPSPSRSRRPRSALPSRGSSSRPKPRAAQGRAREGRACEDRSRSPSRSRRRSPKSPSPTSPRVAPRSCGSTGSARSSRRWQSPDQFRAAIRIGSPFSGRSVMRANGITSRAFGQRQAEAPRDHVSASSASCIANVMPTQMRAPAPNGR